MANINKIISQNFVDSILPTYGNARTVNTPTYDNSQKMFIIEEYESAAGHRYYKGVRFCDRVVFVESVGMYHNWTYIDSLEMYVFNGEKLSLAQKKTYNKEFRSEATIRRDSEAMLQDYMSSQAKLSGAQISSSMVKDQASKLVEGCYKSLLDGDYKLHLTKIVPVLESSNNQKLLR